MVFSDGFISGNKRKTMKNTFIYLILLGSVIICRGQNIAPEVIATAGKDLSAGEYRLSFTIGELAVTTLKPGPFILTQGFQQPPNLYLSDINIHSPLKIQLNAYPNPTTDVVNIIINGLPHETLYKILVYNNFGQVVELSGQNIDLESGTLISIDLSAFARGSYFIRIFSVETSEAIAEFKVIKIN